MGDVPRSFSEVEQTPAKLPFGSFLVLRKSLDGRGGGVARNRGMRFAYILRSEMDGSYCFGSTTNVDERVKQHNQGLSNHTSKYRPWQLVWFGAFVSKARAEAFERYLKTGSGHAFSRKRLI